MADGKSYSLYVNPLLKARARIEGGRVRIESSGTLSRLPVIKSALQMFEGQIPVRVEAERLCLSTWIPPLPSPAFDRLAESRVRGELVADLERYRPALPLEASEDQILTQLRQRVEVRLAELYREFRVDDEWEPR